MNLLMLTCYEYRVLPAMIGSRWEKWHWSAADLGFFAVKKRKKKPNLTKTNIFYTVNCPTAKNLRTRCQTLWQLCVWLLMFSIWFAGIFISEQVGNSWAMSSNNTTWFNSAKWLFSRRTKGAFSLQPQLKIIT